MADRVKHPSDQEGRTRLTPAIKHCWVTGLHGRLPALLLEWRRTEAGFQGRVIHPVVEADDGWVVIEEWLPAARTGPRPDTRNLAWREPRRFSRCACPASSKSRRWGPSILVIN